MKWKLKALAAATMGAGMMLGGPSAFAQTIDGTPCDDPFPGDNGLGQQTCVDPSATRAEGALWTAAEQAVSIMSAIADSSGCLSAAGGSFGGGSVDLDISVNAVFGPQPHMVANATLAGYSYSTTERAHDTTIQNGVRRYETADVAPGTVRGGEVSELEGVFHSDGKFAILIGDADFRHGGAELDEHLIKDFYRGIAVLPTWMDGPNGVCPDVNNVSEADYQAGLCAVADPGDHNSNDPFEPVRIVRDNGLEVTTKKHFVSDLQGTGTLLELGFPVGKWRQTSFYREPNGPGEGQLTYTKVRIAPFGAPVCALQLSGQVSGTPDNPTFDGSISVFPLGTP